MKYIFTVFVFLTFSQKSHATGQIPDYIIINQDTLPIFNNPLEQYFRLVENRDLPEFRSSCGSSACWRGYLAIWELKNDSLFLNRVTTCHEPFCDAQDANLTMMFGKKQPWAYWYSGILIIPQGNIFSYSNMGYDALYENELQLTIKDGRLLNQNTVSNMDFINHQKLENALAYRVHNLKDTLYFQINQRMNWNKIDNSNIQCWGKYLISYHKNGTIQKVRMHENESDSSSFSDRSYDWRSNFKCSRKIKRSLKKLNLSHINAHRNFTIEIVIFYIKKLEIWECELYSIPMTEKEIKAWIQKQMDMSE